MNFIYKVLKSLKMDVKDKTKGQEEVQKNKVRITLTCRNLKSVENGKKFTKSMFRDRQ